MNDPSLITVLSMFVLFSNVGLADHTPSKKHAPISAESLNQRDIIGMLGISLGQCATIDATIISGDDLKLKQHSGSYLLRIRAVNGRAMEGVKHLPFRVHPFSSVTLPNNGFALFEFKRGHKTKRLDRKTRQNLEKGFVGRDIKLITFETGRFEGMPRDLPDDYPTWQDTRFRFVTQLVVLQEVTEGETTGPKEPLKKAATTR